jgi:hypothetical protein
MFRYRVQGTGYTTFPDESLGTLSIVGTDDVLYSLGGETVEGQSSDGRLLSWQLDSMTPTLLASGLGGYPFELAANSQGLFWTSAIAGEVGRYTFSDQTKSVLIRSGGAPRSIKADETHVFWTDVGFNRIVQFNTGTGTMVVLAETRTTHVSSRSTPGSCTG